jgi:uncharacterized protein (TIGR03086 family)
MSTMQPLESFDRAIAVTNAVVGSIRDDQLSWPTPCAEWNVRNILNHVLLGDLIVTASIMGTEHPDRGQDHLGDDPRGAVANGLAMCRAKVGEPGMVDRTVTTPMGEMSVSGLVERRVADLTAHLWDLSRAIGRPTDFDPELNEVVLAHYRARLDGKDRTGMPVAAIQEVGADATASDRLAAYLGREPDFASSRVSPDRR